MQGNQMIVNYFQNIWTYFWIILNPTDAGQPDHPVGAEDIFRPAEVNFSSSGNHVLYLISLHWFDLYEESAIITQICLQACWF